METDREAHRERYTVGRQHQEWDRPGLILQTDKTSLQQGDLRLSGSPSGQCPGGRAQTCHRVPADLRMDLLASVPPTPLTE
ncbi:hypothetical protein PoB_001860600 [Plakobranchus ocellatus]|uniref:Uncharacterized protein n=1 Tax=Plakobranchus ocellatus TaxID=259542 RepID=A0AAV3Z872_9GAST|nr:hypothetical protein PoB_001860600 [Plakobranchus ocellatus]